MASLHRKSNGWQVRYGKRKKGKDSRKTITLGDMSRRDAEAAARHIETLHQCQLLEAMPGGLAKAWLDKLPPRIRNRLADKGLCDHRYDSEVTVRRICEDFLQWKRSLGRVENSIRIYKQAVRMLEAYFGPDCDATTIRPADIDDLVQYGRKTVAAATTLSRRLQNVKSIFKRAARQKLIPLLDFYQLFDSLPKQVRTSKARRFLVPAEVVQQAIQCAANNEQKLIFALARWGGMRIPSEILGLRWEHVDWEREKMLVKAPKQIHNAVELHERWMPIWPEIRPHLKALEQEWTERMYRVAPDVPPDMSAAVITRHRSRHTAAYRKLFLLACYRAGITKSRDEQPWPKVFTNMRSTRVTELRAMYPSCPDAVNYWMNHSEDISQTHYQQWEEFEWREKEKA